MKDTKLQLQHLKQVLAIGQELAGMVALEPLLQRTVAAAIELTHSRRASVLLLDEWTGELCLGATTGEADAPVAEEKIAGVVLESGQPTIVQPTGESPSLLAVALQSQNRRIGVLKVSDKQDNTGFCQEDVEVLSVLTAQATVAIENARLFEAVLRQEEQLRLMATRLSEAEEIERQRLAREMHDLIGQDLTLLTLALRIMEQRFAEGSADQARTCLADALILVDQTTRHVRSIMGDLHPSVLDDQGVIAALHWYGDRFTVQTGIPVTIEGQEPTPRLRTSVESALFRITQEALTKVAQTARASQVTVRMETQNGTVRLIVADDGPGPDSAPRAAGKTWGMDLSTLVERAQAVGGRCQVESDPQQGTRVIVEVAR